MSNRKEVINLPFATIKDTRSKVVDLLIIMIITQQSIIVSLIIHICRWCVERAQGVE